MLVHTRPPIRKTSTQVTLWRTPRVYGHTPCGSCAVCHLTQATKIIDLGLRTPWEQRTLSNCNSCNVIYVIQCPCNLMYIGMTTRKVKVRIGEHRSNIRCGRATTKMAAHFIDLGHNENQLRWSVIEKCDNGKASLYKEQRWVYLCKSHIKGLNEDIPRLQL